MTTRYALVGVGGRGYEMFARPLVKDFGDVAELVALCDPNRHRMALANERLGTTIPAHTDFDAMLADARPDVIIVCTVDGTHHRYIIGALEAGCDVISEKPLTTTASRVHAILDAERRTGRRVTVSFNARYGAAAETLYRLLRVEGVIGRVLSADYTEYLDTAHGADYFRRWHRRMANSGGLLVHKATHHFDQLNWWLGAEPVEVFARGGLRFYGLTRAKRGERCLTCAHTATCEFYLDLHADAGLEAMYLRAEGEDGYRRDACVFADEIDIVDTAAVVIRYADGVVVNYGLHAFSPYEGQRIGFNGTLGRLEVDLVDRYHGADADGRVRVLPFDGPPMIRVSPLFGRPYDVPVEQREGGGGHSDADERIRQHLFRPGTPDPLGQRADSRAGALAALIGIAANESMATGAPVRIADLW
ncbi:MAG TPA: Gfo/Idh/MocA family oxidoreductase [Chloroflexi bacterium]|jgi:predicted dehydrogenase|nr:Gfo/Idh/MocA family oxidoreductase [Chloroflexota bacterium]